MDRERRLLLVRRRPEAVWRAAARRGRTGRLDDLPPLLRVRRGLRRAGPAVGSLLLGGIQAERGRALGAELVLVALMIGIVAYAGGVVLPEASRTRQAL